jgi:hypothetical protein
MADFEATPMVSEISARWMGQVLVGKREKKG